MTPQDTGPMQTSMDRARGELERLVETVRDRGGRALEAVGGRVGRLAFPPIDLFETNDAVHVLADLPGVDAATFDLNVTGLTLTLRGTVGQPLLGTGGTVHRSERSVGAFERSVSLPVAVDSEAATADLKGGLLHVRLPKSTSVVGRKVPVRTADGGSLPGPTF